MKISGRRYDTQQPVEILVENGRIHSVAELPGEDSLPLIAPGFVDLQINGYGGQEFNDFELGVTKVEQVSVAMDADGVTTYLATLVTHGHPLLSHALSVLGQAIDESETVVRRCPGIHLEGPFISSADGPRGAHPLEHCRPPDWAEFQTLQEAARGHIRLLTLSPEYDGSAEFIGRVVESGVRVAIGHTQASSEQIAAAVDAGASLSTHLGNGAHGQIRRHPNYIWDQLAEDRLTATLIADGHHLPPAVLKSFVRAKTPERCFLVSDITGMGGMPAGLYETPGLGSVEVLEDGRLVIPGQQQLLAGAALPMYVGVRVMMEAAGVNLEEAITMCADRPARYLNLEPRTLAPGAPADLVTFEFPSEGPITILRTVNQGELVYERT